MNGAVVPATFLIDGPKITVYLLNPQHARGASKAKYILGFGFSPSDPKALADALVAHAVGNAPGIVKPQPTGPARVVFEGPVRAPDGRDMPLRSVWEAGEADGERTMRFLTAIPLTR